MGIEARALTKRYGEKTAVDDLTFALRPGVVTGFLGPNGAGKTTTMRLILGLDYPTNGQGLHGMRERAAVYDGTLHAGPAPSAGWRVEGHLPAPVTTTVA